jgi:transglutaminase-like putative cysteine protease
MHCVAMPSQRTFRPTVMMTPALPKNTLIFLLTSVGLIVLPHAVNIFPAVFGFFMLLLAWRFSAVWRPQYLPTKRLLLILTVLAFTILFSQYRHLLGRDAGTNLFVLALALKLLEIKDERDIYLVTFLAFIVAATLFLFQQSLLMAAYILIVCFVLFATLVAINSLQTQTWRSLKTAAMIVMQALPLAIVIFVLFPRIESPRWMLFQDKNKAKIGLSDSMEPGSISELGMSDELVFRAKFNGVLPPPKQRYWRGPVLSHTDGKRWTMSGTQLFKKTLLPQPSFSGTAYSYTLLMEAQEKNWVFALEMPAQFLPPLAKTAYHQLVTQEDPNKRAEYQITSSPLFNTGTLTPVEFQDATQLPNEPPEKIKQLVTQLHGFDSPPDVFIQNLLNHFRQENFHYTLKPPLMEEKPIETFLFETRYGFCSHYAAATTYLMRAAGIPARVVTGYQGGAFNAVGNFLEIKQSNAHAWVEVWLTDKGWSRLDPTAAIAPERIEQEMNIDQLAIGEAIRFEANGKQQKNLLKQMRQYWDSADYQWQHWVVNYDTENQSSFLAGFGIHDFKAMLKWLLMLITVVTLLLAALLLRKKRQTLAPVLHVYQQFCKKLQVADLTRDNGEGAVDFAKRAKNVLPEHASAIDDITAAFMQLQYGKDPSRADFIKFKQLVAKFHLAKRRV